MCTVLEVVEFNVAFYLNYLNSLLLTICVKTNSQFRDMYRYNIKPFKHTTVRISALHNVYQSKQNCVFVYLWNCLYSVRTAVHIWPNSLDPYLVQSKAKQSKVKLGEGCSLYAHQIFKQ